MLAMENPYWLCRMCKVGIQTGRMQTQQNFIRLPSLSIMKVRAVVTSLVGYSSYSFIPQPPWNSSTRLMDYTSITPCCFLPSIMIFRGFSKRTWRTYSVSSTAGRASRMDCWKRPSPVKVLMVK